MPNRPVLEICVESMDHAVAAERGGADRVELCTDLSSGGVTPSAEFMQATRSHLRIPIHVLIRPRAGDFCYSDDELEIMRNDILVAKQFGMDGIVLGVLKGNTRVDIAGTKALVELSHPLPVTFHRAFDASGNLEVSLEEVIQTGASRILTSAGQSRATEGLSTLARLVDAAKGRILIMPCGGINSNNVVQIFRTTLAREIHSSARTSNLGSMPNGGLPHNSGGTGASLPSRVFEQEVADLASLLDGVALMNDE